jgi:CBS-domain-containing membrane protein
MADCGVGARTFVTFVRKFQPSCHDTAHVLRNRPDICRGTAFAVCFRHRIDFAREKIMTTATKPFLDLSAIDLMSRDLRIIPDNMPLREAAQLLLRHQVSGAPVVDHTGTLIGVLSATDFVRQLGRRADGSPKAAEPHECFCADWQMKETSELPTDAVRHFMTHDTVTTGPDTPIADLARMMVDAHIHRIIIVDEHNSPLGIVTSTDVLAAVARAHVEEAVA